MYVIIGNPCREILPGEPAPRRRTGGPVLAAGGTLAGLGMPVAAVAHGGLPERESLIASGIDHRLFVVSERTPSLQRQQGTDELLATAGEPISTVDLPLDLAAVHGVILCPVLGELEGFAASPWFNDRTLVSVGGFIARAEPLDRPVPVRRQASATLDELRRTCLVVHASAADARFLTGADDPEEACGRLHTGDSPHGVALVTCGGRGAIAVHGSDFYRSASGSDDPAYGDILAAAFLYAFLDGELAAGQALEFAAATASLAVARRAGPTPSAWPWPSLRDVHQALASS